MFGTLRHFVQGRRLDLIVWLGLTLSITAVYIQTARFDFVNFDDPSYVSRNAALQEGLTPEGIRWACTSVVVGLWAPVTMLSHLAVYQLFQLESGMHHLVNVLFHALASMLLFSTLKRATGDSGPSLFAAMIFALHPLHVESVAWVSERKDVLSAFFWFLALYAYVRYAERPGLRRYLLMAAAFSLGLASKPMLVTFPFTLLLVDVWPLRRWQFPKMIWEKLPLMPLSASAAVAAYLTNRSEGFVIHDIPLTTRLGNTLAGYATYIQQTLWPAGLAVFYPYPKSIPAWKWMGALAVLAAISAAAIYLWRTRPYVATGWFWFLGTLVPVVQLVAVGRSAHSDRYTYVPMVGLTIVLAWGAADVIRKWPRLKPAMFAAAGLCWVACMGLAWRQTGYWRNSETLYRHTIHVTGDNWLAEGNLGNYLMHIPEQREEALEHLQNALRIRPDYPDAENNLGLYLAGIELCGAAIPHFEAALRLQPTLAQAHNNLGLCLTRNGSYGAAIEHLETALRLNPDFAAAHFNLAATLSNVTGRENDAVAQYEAGLRVSGKRPGADALEGHRKLAELLLHLGRREEALKHYEAAEQIQPDAATEEVIGRLRRGQT